MQEKTRKNKVLIIVGILTILLGLSLYGYKLYKDYHNQNLEQELIEDFFIDDGVEEVVVEEEQIVETPKTTSTPINYLMVLEIPKINLKKGIHNINSKYNSVRYGIQILKQSNMPDQDNGNVIFASHRGNSSVSYFNNLHKLVNGDSIYLYYDSVKYTYEIVNMYEVPKTGTIAIHRDSSKNVITLITCKKNEDKQLVFIGNLVNKGNY